MKKKSILTFLKAQLSAFLGGAVDYGCMIFFTEIMGIFYPISICISGIIGAVVNFSINRYWSFSAKDNPISKQLPRFAVVVLGSIFLKSTGTYLLTSATAIDYKWTRIIIDAFVSFGFNYTMQKYWVFRKT